MFQMTATMLVSVINQSVKLYTPWYASTYVSRCKHDHVVRFIYMYIFV